MFSVVITTKDRKDFLIRAVDSICASSIKPIDIVIVNDGGSSIDSSIFQKSSINLRIFNNAESKGANFCRNFGVEQAGEDIVFLLDDDDAVTHRSFENRIRAFNDEKVGLSFTGIQIVFADNLFNVKRTLNACSLSSYFPSLLADGNVVGSTSRVAIRKGWFNKSGRFDERLNCFQDYDLWIRMSKICKFSSDCEAGVLYTIHKRGNQVSSNYQKYMNAAEYLIEKYKDEASATNTLRAFRSHLYLRVGIAAAGNDFWVKSKYCWLSFMLKPSKRALVLLLVPTIFLKKIFSFV